MIENFELNLETIRVLSETTREFRFVRTDGKPVTYLPGQFYRFSFEDDSGSFERSYSLANFNGPVGCSAKLDLLISYVKGGRASRYLFDRDPSALVQSLRCTAKGPYGRLVLPSKIPKRLIMVATSVGLAPFMPILNQLDQVMLTDPVTVALILGVRSPDEFIYADKLIAYEQSHPNFSLTVCYSRQMPGDGDTRAMPGYVQEGLFKMDLEPLDDHVLLCGNPRMIDDVFGKMKIMGFGVRNVVREKYVYARESASPKKQVPGEAHKRLIAEKLAQVKARQGDN
jgi:ferredoxin-NADP reductase